MDHCHRSKTRLRMAAGGWEALLYLRNRHALRDVPDPKLSAPHQKRRLLSRSLRDALSFGAASVASSIMAPFLSGPDHRDEAGINLSPWPDRRGSREAGGSDKGRGDMGKAATAASAGLLVISWVFFVAVRP
jgi:hypothetical protein